MSESSKQPDSPQLCTECKDMFGHPNFKGMCSKCYKRVADDADKAVSLILKKKSTEALSPLVQKTPNKPRPVEMSPIAQMKPQKNEKYEQQLIQQNQKERKVEANKCKACSKKVGLLGYCCSHCNEKYCKLHRLPEEHQCNADFVDLGRKKLKLENPLLQPSKIQKI